MATSMTAGARYLRDWRAVPGIALYLVLLSLPLAIVAMSLTLTTMLLGIGMIVLVIGLPLITGALYLSRWFADTDRTLLRLSGLPPIPAPDWTRGARGTTIWQRLLQPLRNGHYWTAFVHSMIVRPVTALLTFPLAVAWVALSLGGLTYWFWGSFVPDDDSRQIWVPWVFERLGIDLDVTKDLHLWTSLIYIVAGVVFAVTLPLVLRGLVLLHHSAARVMLGRWDSDDFEAAVASMDASRGAAVQAEDVALRRLERDIHDGPQQRLVRLQMDLAAIERRAAAGDADAVAKLAAESREHARSALDELRALSSGMVPPLLQDRGLVEALGALASTSPVPVHANVDPTVGEVVTGEHSRNIYFIVTELLTNVAKHAQATEVALRVAALDDEVLVHVRDDGKGGAQLQPGHGLHGLAQRVQGLRGTLSLESPAGGPTAIEARIPLAVASARSSLSE